jgi:hypothetical protein
MTHMSDARASGFGIAVLAVTLILTACGPSTPPAPAQAQASPTSVSSASPTVSASPTAVPSASPTAVPEFLFAVTESNPFPSEPNTVAIVGLDGYARARATFRPRVGPIVPDAYVPLQGIAQVAGSGVYYIDSAGTVRVLRVGSQPQIVARFPLQSAQEDVWFAVSPDGSRVMAGIFTFPALGPIIPGTNWNTMVGPSRFDLETALAGGLSKTLVHWSTTYGAEHPTIFPVGWTSPRRLNEMQGPVAMVSSPLSSQNSWPGGPLYVIDDSGRKTTLLGGPNCDSASITSSGLIACSSGRVVTVRDETGPIIWTTHIDAFSAAYLFVSPDGQAISDGNAVERHVGGMVAISQGHPGFRIEGWLDNHTVVGRIVIDDVNEGDLAWIDINHPSTVHDLGFKGDFVATLG